MPSQSYREFTPPPALAPYLTCFWIQEVPAGGGEYRQLSVPNGSAEIVCDLSTGAIHVTGPQTQPRRGRVSAGQTVVGARFAPGASTALLRLPGCEIADRHVGLADSGAAVNASLGELLAETGSAECALALLSRELLRRADPPPSRWRVGDVVERLQPWSRSSIEQVSRDLFLSERQLRRRCHDAFGCGPKQLQRILRFQAFMALVDGGSLETHGLAECALASGYVDQPHLTRESVRLTGLSPARFLSELSAGCGPHHDHAASFARPRRMLSRASGHTSAHRPSALSDVRFVQDQSAIAP